MRKIAVLFAKLLLKFHTHLVSKQCDNQAYPSDPFPEFTQSLEKHWATILKEASDYQKQLGSVGVSAFYAEQKVLADEASWQSVPLILFGHGFKNNLAAFPKTTELLSEFGRVSSAMISILPPNSSIKGHFGPFKGVLRYHLGLQIPAESPACSITVNSIEKGWSEGKVLILDDTFFHSAKNTTARQRVVLFIDVNRRLSLGTKYLTKCLFWGIKSSTYTQRALRKYTSLQDQEFIAWPSDF